MRTLPATSLLALAASLALPWPAPALAQDANPPAPAEPAPAGDAPETSSDPNQIVVTGQSLRGTVDAPQPPVLELNEADIAAYGAGSMPSRASSSRRRGLAEARIRVGAFTPARLTAAPGRPGRA